MESKEKIQIRTCLRFSAVVHLGGGFQQDCEGSLIIKDSGNMLWRLKHNEKTSKQLLASNSLLEKPGSAWPSLSEAGSLDCIQLVPEESGGTPLPYISLFGTNSSGFVEFHRVNTCTGEAKLVFSTSKKVVSAISVSPLRTDAHLSDSYPDDHICTVHQNYIYFATTHSVFVVDSQRRFREVMTSDRAISFLAHPSLLHPTPERTEAMRSSAGSCTWAHIGENTVLLDLQLGTRKVFFDSRIFPLFTPYPGQTVAIQSKQLGFVDWENFEIDFLKENVGWKSNITMAKDFREGFCFLPSFNQLFGCRSSGIIRYSKVFSFTYDCYDPSTYAYWPDFSDLLSTDQSVAPGDLKLTHRETQTTWNVHYRILQQHEPISTRHLVDWKLVPVIENSTLPPQSISLFLRYLYGNSSLNDGNANESFLKVVHAIHLCILVGIDTRYLHFLLKEQILPKFGNDELLRHLIGLWIIFPDPKTYPAIEVLAERCKTFVTDQEIREALAKFAPGTHCGAGVLLTGPKMMEHFGSKAHTTDIDPHLAILRPIMRSFRLKWDEKICITSPPTPPDDTCAYIFLIHGEENKGGVISYSWLLYPQWKWFERLVNSKLDETKTRHIVMPAGITRDMLLEILSVAHGTFLCAYSLQKMPRNELLILCSFISELQLDISPAYALFIKHCRGLLSSTITEATCIDGALELWNSEILLDDPLFIITLSFTARRLRRELMTDLTGLPHGLQRLITTFEQYGEDSDQFTYVVSNAREATPNK